MLFFSFFKTLVGKEVAVEMKNDVVLTGTLVSVDQYLNVKLSNVYVVDTDRYPQLVRKIDTDRKFNFAKCSCSFDYLITRIFELLHFLIPFLFTSGLTGSYEKLLY